MRGGTSGSFDYVDDALNGNLIWEAKKKRHNRTEYDAWQDEGIALKNSRLRMVSFHNERNP